MTGQARRIVVVGHGIAGVTAAQAARAQDEGAQISIVGDEPYDAYYRVRLSHDLATGIDPEKIRLRSPRWYEQVRIAVVRGVAAARLDLPAGRLELADGRALDWESCVLAMGSSSFLPPFRGNRRPGVHTLRSAGDAVRIRDLAAAAEGIAVAGGGLLGLEVAYALSRLGKPVTVLERGPWLLRRQLDRDGGELLAAVLGRAGVSVLTGEEVAAALGAPPDDAGVPLHSVLLKSGRVLSCGLLVVAAGVRPNVQLALDAGVEASPHGITVDDGLRTSVPTVYACGDVAAHPAGNYAIWPQAMAQGRVAGTNAAGGAETYSPVIPQNLLTVAGTSVLAVGEAGAASAEPPSALAPLASAPRGEVSRSDVGAGRYAKFVFRGVTLSGVMLVGEPDLARVAGAAVTGGRTFEGLWDLPGAGRFDRIVRDLTGHPSNE